MKPLTIKDYSYSQNKNILKAARNIRNGTVVSMSYDTDCFKYDLKDIFSYIINKHISLHSIADRGGLNIESDHFCISFFRPPSHTIFSNFI